jgi:hypothetical protein
MSLNLRSTRSAFRPLSFITLISFIGCATKRHTAPGDIAPAIWTFLESIRDTACAKCPTIYVHPIVVLGSRTPVADYRNVTDGIDLAPAVGNSSMLHESHEPILRISRLEDTPARPGSMAFVAHFPETGTGADKYRLLMVDMYVARDGHWLLEGSAIAQRSRKPGGLEFSLVSFRWT